MSTRVTEHWTVVDWAERVIGALCIAAGILLVRWGSDWIGGGLVGAGIIGVMPKARPYLSKLIDKVPGLPTKGDGA